MKELDILDAAVLAKEHWEWLVKLLEKVYCDAFIHGFKHGRESMET